MKQIMDIITTKIVSSNKQLHPFDNLENHFLHINKLYNTNNPNRNYIYINNYNNYNKNNENIESKQKDNICNNKIINDTINEQIKNDTDTNDFDDIIINNDEINIQPNINEIKFDTNVSENEDDDEPDDTINNNNNNKLYSSSISTNKTNQNREGILDSGATNNQISHQHAKENNIIINKLKHPYITKFANGEHENIQFGGKIGEYNLHICPSIQDPLISVHSIVDAGHVVEFHPYNVQIKDINNNYIIKIPRPNRLDKMWTIPFEILQKLTDKKQHFNSRNNNNKNHNNTKYINYPNNNNNNNKSNSATIKYDNKNTFRKVLYVHECMGHASKQTMCNAIKGSSPLWYNTGLTENDIEKAFYKEPCLWCVLGKRNQKSARKLKYIQKQSTTINNDNNNDNNTSNNNNDNNNNNNKVTYLPYEIKENPGECFSADINGPVSPLGINKEKYWLILKDIATDFRVVEFSKTPITSAIFLNVLDRIRLYIENKGFKIKTVRADYAQSFLSGNIEWYYLQHNINKQHSQPYQHYQNSVERDVQTIIKKSATIIHAQLWFRPDCWPLAIQYVIDVDNHLPKSYNRTSPLYTFEKKTIDARYNFQYPFGQLLCYHIPKELRTWKFDMRQNIGIFVGNQDEMKDAAWVYSPVDRDVKPRGDLAPLNVSNLQFMEWFIKKLNIHESKTPLIYVKEAMTSFMRKEPLTITIEGIDTNITIPQTAIPSHNVQPKQHNIPQRITRSNTNNSNNNNNNDNHTHERNINNEYNNSSNNIQNNKNNVSDNNNDDDNNDDDNENNEIDNEHNNDNITYAMNNIYLNNFDKLDTTINDFYDMIDLSICYYNTSQHNNTIYTTINEYPNDVRQEFMRNNYDNNNSNNHNNNNPYIDNEFNNVENITNEYVQYMKNPYEDTDDQISLKMVMDSPAEEKEAWIKETKREYDSLLHVNQALIPVTKEWLDNNKNNYDIIPTKTIFKKKLKGDGTFDKLKCRTALRGDILLRKYLQQRIKPPKTYSPTISYLTFIVVLQIAIIYKLHRATLDVVSAYLQILYPKNIRQILVRFDPRICELLGLDPKTLYRVNKYIYGLLDAGRQFYLKYTETLIELGYQQSKCDPCLFYKIDSNEITFICNFVDDAYIFSNKKENIQILKDKIDKIYSTTIEYNANSYLGINFKELPDGSIQLNQNKLLNKILNTYSVPIKSRARIPTPYGPIINNNNDNSNNNNNNNKSPPIDKTTYLQLLGSLLYMTKSRPELLASCSIQATKSRCPTEEDYLQLLYIVEYLRATKDEGLILHTTEINNKVLQLYCEVDATYLFHDDSKGHTGYCIGFAGIGFFYFKSIKQQLVSTSSTQAEMRALFTLTKDIIYIIELLNQINIPLNLPAIIMEDNSAVITMATEECAMLKKCKHFLMIINYVKDIYNMKLIIIHKIMSMKNASDLLTKKLRGSEFTGYKKDKMLGISRPFPNVEDNK
jgi:hypothetical protein